MKNYHKNPSRPKISVVIPAFNEEKFIGKTLLSLLKQDFKDFEIIVVDNNSTDKTAKIAKKFGAILVSEKNQGVAFARQKGFLNAKGKIVASTDADTILPRNWLSRIFEEFEKDENLVAFGGSCYFYSGPILVRLASRYFLTLFLIFDKFFSDGWNLMGCNMAIRKEAFFKIGGFNTNLKLNEESEISSRLRKVGKVILDPNFKVKTSGRRYRHGLIFGLMNYAPSTIFRFLFKKYDKFQNFPPVRKEESLIGKFSFPIISLFVFSFLLFHLSTPKIVLAKNLIKRDLNKVVFVEKRIKNEAKNDFGKIKNLKIENERNIFNIRRRTK
jgi:glycosyltransferase involved in cell wall biosynthesis